jgi:hypothetical protein
MALPRARVTVVATIDRPGATMTRTPSLVFAAGAAATLLLLGACATPLDASHPRLDDIVRIPLQRPDAADDGSLAARSGAALAPSAAGEPERVKHEEALRRELGVDYAPDGSWDGCFRRSWGEGC